MFSPGDRVSVVNEPVYGTVLAVFNNTVRIATADGFELDYPAGQLIALHPDSDKMKKIPGAHGKDYPVTRKKSINAKLHPPVCEIDLHMYQLMDEYEHLTNTEIVRYQMNYLKQQLNKARAAAVTRVIIIHGVGQGVLRNEVRNLLSKMDQTEFFDASLQEYGHGATEVRFWYK